MSINHGRKKAAEFTASMENYLKENTLACLKIRKA